MVKAAVVRVTRLTRKHHEGYGGKFYFAVYYRVLKRGPKPIREKYWLATDELEAFMLMQGYLQQQGYKLA